jgi:hypothetical protein
MALLDDSPAVYASNKDVVKNILPLGKKLFWNLLRFSPFRVLKNWYLNSYLPRTLYKKLSALEKCIQSTSSEKLRETTYLLHELMQIKQIVNYHTFTREAQSIGKYCDYLKKRLIKKSHNISMDRYPPKQPFPRKPQSSQQYTLSMFNIDKMLRIKMPEGFPQRVYWQKTVSSSEVVSSPSYI